MTVMLHRLNNGIPVLIDPMPHTDMASTGIYITTGAAQETPENNGISHFLEHMAFKGTETMTVTELAEAAADLGANFNAYTACEVTAYTMDGLATEASQFIRILDDVVRRSILPADELEIERNAVLQEIARSNDDPDDLSISNALKMAYPDQSYGAPILGTKENIRTLSRDTMKQYMDRKYHGGNVIISAAGNVDPGRILEDLNGTVGSMAVEPPNAYSKAVYRGGMVHVEKPIEQVHLHLMFNSIGATNPKRFALTALSDILGGGNYSRLFREVRGKRGLVYEIGMSSVVSRNSGIFGVYAGTETEHLAALMPVIADEISRIREEPVTEKELERTKKQLLTSLAGSQDSVTNRREGPVWDYFNFGRAVDIEEDRTAYKNLTPADILAIANEVFSGQMTISTVGPGKTLQPVEQFESHLKL